MSRITIGERLIAAAAGAFFGAIIGGVLAWMFGVYSSRLGPSETPIDGLHWVSGSAFAFALVGLLLGSHAGTVVGKAITAIFDFERGDERASEWHAPQWLVVAVLLGVTIGVWWWLAR